ncbi:MAG TPA: adenylate cyclase regulatory domain-containing protein [Acidimicrobiales bacterium]|nr:adenylate cyclase regulatory domain-containing protein [Acidimicrobiales bacterium]
MSDQVSIEDLALRTGEAVATLVEWDERELIGDVARQSAAASVERIWLVRSLLARGVAIEDVEAAVRVHGGLVERFVGQLIARGGPVYSLEDAARAMGVDTGVVLRLWESAGLGDVVGAWSADDLNAVRALRSALDAGFPEEALVQVLRVYGEALRRVAEAETRLFHVYVHQRLRREGLSGDELMDATDAASGPLQELVEPTVLYFHRKAWDRAVREDLVTHLAEEAGLWPTIDAEGRLPVAVAFVDLSGFTSLTAAMGDVAAAQVVERFAAMVRDIVVRSTGQVVKQIGDGFMLLFPDVGSAVRGSVALERRVSDEPQFPSARSGIHWGPVLYRDGDYVGATVNIAARVVAEAAPHEVLVTPPVVDQARRLTDIELVPVGRRRLRGLPEEVELFAAQSPAGLGVDKQVDPVCRMELAPAEADARLTLGGHKHVFCSSACLQLFVAAPDRYT